MTRTFTLSYVWIGHTVIYVTTFYVNHPLGTLLYVDGVPSVIVEAIK